MGNKFINFIFFSNYFVGLLSIALSVEMSMQSHLPFNSISFYALLFIITVLYYTYAYIGPANANNSSNPRTLWYKNNHNYVIISQIILSVTGFILLLALLCRNISQIMCLEPIYWLMAIITLLAALLYYGLLPKSFIKINLRGSGWIKAFVIGFVWASCVNILPLIALRIERGYISADPLLVMWLFVKNFMFCTVNAIMFDIKDYADDSNRQLKTFVVRYGLRKTIFFIIIPLLVIGVISVFLFTYARNANWIYVAFNLLPFLCLLYVAQSLKEKRPILFYLVIIDGLIFFKAFCGILAMLFTD